MAIDDNIKEVQDKLIAEQIAVSENPGAPTPFSDEVRSKAKAAIFGGFVEYVDYMWLFAKNAEELARLLPTEKPIDPNRQEARAYLIRNGICGHGTGNMLPNNVAGRL